MAKVQSKLFLDTNINIFFFKCVVYHGLICSILYINVQSHVFLLLLFLLLLLLLLLLLHEDVIKRKLRVVWLRIKKIMISNFCIFSWSETDKTQSCIWARTVKYECNTEVICKWSAVHGLHEQWGFGLWGLVEDPITGERERKLAAWLALSQDWVGTVGHTITVCPRSMSKPRQVGGYSARLAPEGPSWAVRQQEEETA